MLLLLLRGSAVAVERHLGSWNAPNSSSRAGTLRGRRAGRQAGGYQM